MFHMFDFKWGFFWRSDHIAFYVENEICEQIQRKDLCGVADSCRCVVIVCFQGVP